MNILDLKRKALGYRFRDEGGEGGEGSDSDGGWGSYGGSGWGTGGYTTGSTSNFGSSGSTTSTGFGGVGFDPSVASTNPTTTSLTGLPSMAPGVQALANVFGLGPLANMYAGISSLKGTTSDISGNQTQFNGAGMDLGSFFSSDNLGGIASIASGINSIFGGGSSDISSGVQSAADPFAPYRANLAKMYAGALTQGATVDPTQMPGYSQWKSGVLDPALEASKRSAAASGQLYSGGEAQALQKTGQQGYYGFMTDYLNRLATGSGAGVAPYSAANLGYTAGTASQQATSQGIGAIATGVKGLFGGSSGGYTDMTGFQTPYSAPTYTPSFTVPDTTSLGTGGYIPSGTYNPDSIEWFS